MILVAISLRPGIVSIGPVLPAISGEFGLSHAAASLLTSIPDVLMGLLALPTPWLSRRFGRNPVLLLALLVECGSVAIRAFSPNTAVLLTSTAGIGAGIAVAGALIAGFIKARFPDRAALLMGVYATALSFGSTVSAAVTGPVGAARPDGWRLASGMWSVLGIVSIVAWLLVALKERRHVPASTVDAPTRLPVCNRTAWLIALFFACDNFLFYALLSWTSPLYREAGLSLTAAGFVLASFTAAFMAAAPVFGSLSRSTDRRPWLAAASLMTIGGLALTAAAPGLAPFVAIPLCAFGLGGGFTLGMTLPLDNTRGIDEANVWNAFVLTVGYLVASTGPLLVGYLRDVTGDFHMSMWILTGVALAMLLFTPFLHPHRRQGNEA